MFYNLDLLVGSYFPVFFSLYYSDCSYAVKIILIIVGCISGIMYKRFLGSFPDRFINIVFRLFIIESILFWKLYYIDVDMTLQFSLAPFLLLNVFLTSLPPFIVSIEKYMSVAIYVFAVLGVIGFSLMIVYEHKQFKDPLYMMQPWYIYSSCFWFAVETDFLWTVIIVTSIFTIDLFSTFLQTILWQTDSVVLWIIQGIFFLLICVVYSLRLTQIFPKRQHIFVLQVVLAAVVFVYMRSLCIVSGVFSFFIILHDLIYKIKESK